MKRPHNSRQHRDAVLGVSFLISTIDYWPSWRGPLPSVQKVRPLLQKIHDSLVVGRIPEGEARDIGKACDAACDFGAAQRRLQKEKERFPVFVARLENALQTWLKRTTAQRKEKGLPVWNSFEEFLIAYYNGFK